MGRLFCGAYSASLDSFLARFSARFSLRDFCGFFFSAVFGLSIDFIVHLFSIIETNAKFVNYFLSSVAASVGSPFVTFPITKRAPSMQSIQKMKIP